MVRQEHAGAQQEATDLRESLEDVTSPSLLSTVGATIFKTYIEIGSTDMGEQVTPLQTPPRCRCHSHLQVSLPWDFLMSSLILMLVWADNGGGFCGKVCSVGTALIVLSWLALSRAVELKILQAFYVIAWHHSDFFFSFFFQKRKRKWEIELLCLLCFCTLVICHLTLSHPVGSQWFPARSCVSYWHITFKELENVFLYFKNNDIPFSLLQMCW